MNQPNRKRRFFSFSLRTLLICMLLLACLFGWIGIRYRRALEQQAILDRIKATGGFVYLDVGQESHTTWDLFFDGNYINRIEEIMYLHFGNRPSTNLEALAQLKNLKRLNLEDKLVTDIAPLTRLKNLEQLNLISTDVTNLAPLAGLKNLENLSLAATPVTNLRPLTRLKNLQRLDLHGTDVTDLAPLAGLKNLKELDLSSTDVLDIAPLADLKNLKKLYLDGRVDDKDIERLKIALPNCKIIVIR